MHTLVVGERIDFTLEFTAANHDGHRPRAGPGPVATARKTTLTVTTPMTWTTTATTGYEESKSCPESEGWPPSVDQGPDRAGRGLPSMLVTTIAHRAEMTDVARPRGRAIATAAVSLLLAALSPSRTSAVDTDRPRATSLGTLVDASRRQSHVHRVPVELGNSYTLGIARPVDLGVSKTSSPPSPSASTSRSSR